MLNIQLRKNIYLKNNSKTILVILVQYNSDFVVDIIKYSKGT